MTFLTPLGAFVALAALLPLGGVLLGHRRVDAVRRALGLPPPVRKSGLAGPATLAAGIALLGLAAAQPALTHESSRRVRKDVQALFVLDTSRSMAASASQDSPTRLDRAVAAAERLRASIPEVESGVATLTDRVLPDLLPVADRNGFDGVLERTVRIEIPPPRESTVRATTYAALGDIPAGGYFDPAASHRVVVLLTDGESNLVDSAEVARALAGKPTDDLLAIRFWQSGEEVYGSGGKPDAAYRPDPSGRVVLRGLAAATGGRAFEERDLGGAASYLRTLVGHGPTVPAAGTDRRRVSLAPYAALLALVLVLAAIRPMELRRMGRRLTTQ
jgi:hypothetical protein